MSLLSTTTPEENEACHQDQLEDPQDEDVDVDDLEKEGVWKISKCVNGQLMYMHVKQAIKILLPCEYISQCYQKRHCASTYLPGKKPLNPKHDIYKCTPSREKGALYPNFTLWLFSQS